VLMVDDDADFLDACRAHPRGRRHAGARGAGPVHGAVAALRVPPEVVLPTSRCRNAPARSWRR
jgi:hypothetical protein